MGSQEVKITHDFNQRPEVVLKSHCFRIQHLTVITQYNAVLWATCILYYSTPFHFPSNDQTNNDGNLSHFMKLPSCQQTTHDRGDLGLPTLVLKLTCAVTGLRPIVLLCPGSAGAHTSHKRLIHTLCRMSTA